MVILGIDPGYGIVGFGVIDTSKRDILVDYGVITTPKEDSMPVRLETIDGSLKYPAKKVNRIVKSKTNLLLFRLFKNLSNISMKKDLQN